MRCACCDNELSSEEITWNKDCEMWEYCTSCLLIISDVFSDPLTEEEITTSLDEEEILDETLLDADYLLSLDNL